MRETAYTMAVARIRANENHLLTQAEIDRLLAARDAEEVSAYLTDKGYGGVQGGTGDAMFGRERERAWTLIREIAPDFSLFFPMLCKNDFHNMKALIKGTISGVDPQGLLMLPTATPLEDLRTAVSDRRFDRLPAYLQTASAEAYDALAHSGDGQLADILLDRAYLDAVVAYGRSVKDAFVKGYCELVVAMTNIRVAARCAKTGKAPDLIQTALCPCDTLDVRALYAAALDSVDAVADYLTSTSYKPVAELLQQSIAAAERWCDNQTYAYVRSARYEIFGISPLYQYLVSKEAEISAVKIIYTGKRAGFSEDKIRQYLRTLV